MSRIRAALRAWTASWSTFDRAVVHAATDWLIVAAFGLAIVLGSHPTTLHLTTLRP